MTEEQFKNLKVGDEITHLKVMMIHPMKVKEIVFEEGIISTEGGALLRYENCELVGKDELVKYLNQGASVTLTDRAKEIRSIVRKEMIDMLMILTNKEIENADIKLVNHFAEDGFVMGAKWMRDIYLIPLKKLK